MNWPTVLLRGIVKFFKGLWLVVWTLAQAFGQPICIGACIYLAVKDYAQQKSAYFVLLLGLAAYLLLYEIYSIVQGESAFDKLRKTGKWGRIKQ